MRVGTDPGLGDLARLLIARTEGNPFFLEESVRSLAETGVLAGQPGAYRPARPVDTIEIPVSVHALLAARIDRLPADEKQGLQAAAVVGHCMPASPGRSSGSLATGRPNTSSGLPTTR